MGRENSPSKECCQGVKSLANHSKKKTDRVSICQCLEQSVAMFPGLDISLVSKTPASCGLKLKLPPIDSVSFDCSKA
ncbi:hypothetical protein M5689_008320 [Euphorbia peplus]|nr:hypothetical protein M5689_008320 [Euphorbia peplus]